MILLNHEGTKLIRKSVEYYFVSRSMDISLNLRILNNDLVTYAESFAYNHVWSNCYRGQLSLECEEIQRGESVNDSQPEVVSFSIFRYILVYFG